MVTILVNNEFQAEMSWDSLDFASLSVYTVGTALTMVLLYYGLKTLKLFKGNVAARAWTYISLSAVLWSRCGHVPRRFTRTYGLVGRRGVMQTVGALFLFLGLRKNYQFWESKDHFA